MNQRDAIIEKMRSLITYNEYDEPDLGAAFEFVRTAFIIECNISVPRKPISIRFHMPPGQQMRDRTAQEIITAVKDWG